MLNIAMIALGPFAALFILQTIYLGSLPEAIYWITEYPEQFIASYLICFGIVNIWYILPRRAYAFAALLASSILALLAFASRQKLLLRQEPLLPYDFKLAREAINIVSGAEHIDLGALPLLWIALTGVMILSILTGLIIAFLYERYCWRHKLSVFAVSFVLLVAMLQLIPLEKTFDLRMINWNQQRNYAENGMLIGMLLNYQYGIVHAPGEYDEPHIREIIEQQRKAYAIDENFRPNIVIVMSEAFWDPTVLPGVSFSEDPLPYFHELQKESSSGILLSPVYGGGTANTEFEVLTGCSTEFLPAGSIPYATILNKTTDALPAMLSSQGYRTTAIHTYEDWFYRRDTVYADIGFERFISKDDFIEPSYYGQFIRDTELSDKILEVLDETEKPNFIFALSMQAHGPYSNEKNPENAIKVEGDLAPTSLSLLENYTNIIADVDHSIRLLMDGLKKQKEPTMLVFFGDHLPMLGEHFDVYKESYYFDEQQTYEQYLKKYSVPIIVWDNYSDKREDLRMSSSFLGPFILASSKNKGNALTDFLYDLSTYGNTLLYRIDFLRESGITEEQLNWYRLLQYDILLGEGYSLRN